MDDAIKTIVTLLGAGGLTTVILGVLGFLKGRDKPAETHSGTAMLTTLYADQSTINRVSSALERLTDTVDRGIDAVKDSADAVRESTRETRRR